MTANLLDITNSFLMMLGSGRNRETRKTGISDCVCKLLITKNTKYEEKIVENQSLSERQRQMEGEGGGIMGKLARYLSSFSYLGFWNSIAKELKQGWYE